MIRKLVDAMVHGFGATAGADLYGEAKRALAKDEPPPVDPRDAARRAQREAKARARERRDADAAIEAELRALKRKIARGAP